MVPIRRFSSYGRRKLKALQRLCDRNEMALKYWKYGAGHGDSFFTRMRFSNKCMKRFLIFYHVKVDWGQMDEESTKKANELFEKTRTLNDKV